jgi:hypothetical protein
MPCRVRRPQTDELDNAFERRRRVSACEWNPPRAVLSDEVCGVGVTDAALGAGKAIRDRHDQEVEKEILI